MVSNWFRKEDSWAAWLGLACVVAVVTQQALQASFMDSVTLNPGGLHWHNLGHVGSYFLERFPNYLLQLSIFIAVFASSIAVMGFSLERFLAGFALLYPLALVTFVIAGWADAARYELEPPVVALGLGLLIGNTTRLPAALDAGFRVEYYVKLGIVLLGATFPISLLISAGPVAIVQAALVAVTTALTIYFVGTRVFKLDRRLAAVLSTGGSVCGVSASMATSAAVGARKSDLYQTITLVIAFALIMIIALPIAAQMLGLPAGVAGAWIGTSEFADAAGFAAAAAYGQMVHHQAAALHAFTLMKVIGRDAWIGIWSFVWAIVAVRWKTAAAGVAPTTASFAKEVWRRFPKFLFGFFAAAFIMSALTSGMSQKEIVPLLAPLVGLRTWAFVLCFLSIGLTTRFRELPGVSLKAVAAFTCGVLVNVALGYVFSTQVFVHFWSHLA